MAEHHADTPSVKIDMLYSLGTLGRSTLGFIVSSWLLYYYLPPNGKPLIPIALYGAAIIAGRIIGAALAPLIGYLSDNSQSSRGRRLPFMFFAAFPLTLFFVLIWMPPSQENPWLNLLYLSLIFGLFRVALGFYQIPLESLLPEIAGTDRHRVRLSAWQSVFLLVGMVIGGAAGLLIDGFGYLGMALIYSALALLTFYIPLPGLRRFDHQKIAPADRIKFWHSLSITWKNRTFMIFAATWSLYIMTTSLLQSSAPYIVTEVCRLQKGDTIYFYIPGLLASLASYPLITWMVKRWGKRNIFAGSFLAAALIFPGTALIGWLPTFLKAQCISWAILQSVAISGAAITTSAFVAEIADHDHGLTGQRREGMYYSTLSLLEQFVTGIASILLPLIFLFGRSQFAPLGPLGVRLTGVIGGALMLIGFFLFLRYSAPQKRADLDLQAGQPEDKAAQANQIPII